ncbi:MAG: GIY-YIG nuclease family protein [Sphingobacteriaceae bacterium]|nr:GIY-YIG nuclease family protein [Sphingobacteriaceae bacterium]
MEKFYTIYVIYSDAKKVKYTGYTDDLDRRLKEHNEGILGKFTKNKGPWRLIYQEEVDNIIEARKREKYLKTGSGRDFIKLKTGY